MEPVDYVNKGIKTLLPIYNRYRVHRFSISAEDDLPRSGIRDVIWVKELV